MSQPILKVDKLVKEYGKFRAVDGISFSVPKGKVVGFLGPNGAGKTTTIHMLLGITLKTAGKIQYFGKDFDTHREYCLSKINFASTFNTLLGRVTVMENLLVFAQLYAVKDPKKTILKLLKYFEIEHLQNSKYWDLSAGQKTRVNLIKALINDPELVLLDEPTASLDPDIADKLLQLIETLKKEKNISMLYTSHDMAEVTRVCDEVIFLDHGKIVAQDTPIGLTKRIQEVHLHLLCEDSKAEIESALKKYNHKFEFLDTKFVSIETKEDQIASTIHTLTKDGLKIVDVEIKKPTLEDVFLQIARKDKV